MPSVSREDPYIPNNSRSRYARSFWEGLPPIPAANDRWNIAKTRLRPSPWPSLLQREKNSTYGDMILVPGCLNFYESNPSPLPLPCSFEARQISFQIPIRGEFRRRERLELSTYKRRAPLPKPHPNHESNHINNCSDKWCRYCKGAWNRGM